MAEADGEAFWQFSLAFYGRPGVSAACLELQDRHGRDVNLVLYLCWLGLSGRGRIAAGDLVRADGIITAWRRRAIEPLRAARRALKPSEQEGVAQLYEAAKAVELAAERLGQHRLAALAPPAALRAAEDCASDAVANLALYLCDAATRQAAAPIFGTLTIPSAPIP